MLLPSYCELQLLEKATSEENFMKLIGYGDLEYYRFEAKIVLG